MSENGQRPLGNKCPDSHDLDLYRAWERYDRAMASYRGKNPPGGKSKKGKGKKGKGKGQQGKGQQA